MLPTRYRQNTVLSDAQYFIDFADIDHII
jgi:hypothetical protein